MQDVAMRFSASSQSSKAIMIIKVKLLQIFELLSEKHKTVAAQSATGNSVKCCTTWQQFGERIIISIIPANHCCHMIIINSETECGRVHVQVKASHDNSTPQVGDSPQPQQYNSHCPNKPPVPRKPLMCGYSNSLVLRPCQGLQALPTMR